MQERLQKLMSQAGVASRRESETLIIQGRVMVNGKPATLGDKADPATDDIRVDGERLKVSAEHIYVIVNKPMGVVTVSRAQRQETRRTVRDLVPLEGYLYPVGRLDADSEGLVLLTNDGDLAQKLSHPRFEHPKIYEVTLYGRVSDEKLDVWRRGVVLDEEQTRPVEIQVLERSAELTLVRMTMHEGRKRQIRRIAVMLGCPVRRLVRVQLDTLKLGELKPGEWRALTEAELRILQLSAARKAPARQRRRARPPMYHVQLGSEPQPPAGEQDQPRARPPRRHIGEPRSERPPRPARSGQRPTRRATPIHHFQPGPEPESPAGEQDRPHAGPPRRRADGTGSERPSRLARPGRRPASGGRPARKPGRRPGTPPSARRPSGSGSKPGSRPGRSGRPSPGGQRRKPARRPRR